MNKEKLLDCLIPLLILIIGTFFFRLMIVGMEDTIPRNNLFCETKYGLEDRGHDKFFGDYCAKVHHKNLTVERFYYTHKDMMEYCPPLKYWDLAEWSIKCDALVEVNE